ncbi:MAG: hypothetical protein MR488_04290 [Lachnospiraceae bacterium]|jgi:hypothetical protein|nr:hypothetical protein [Lachnospiraceae bacterium]
MNETEILENQETAPAASPTVDGSTEESGSDDIVSSETVQVIDTPEVLASKMSYNVAVLFVLSMLVGLIIFHILSRRWQT